jgi:hypothetical protein
MMIQKWLPGFLYQTGEEGKRARQQRDRERVCVLEAEHCRERERDGVGNKIDGKRKHVVRM